MRAGGRVVGRMGTHSVCILAAHRHPRLRPHPPQRKKEGKTETEETADERLMRIAEEQSHLFVTKPEKDAIVKRLEAWEAKLEKLAVDMRSKDDNKSVALGTSKINYIDPRITVAWCKRVELPIERVFQTSLRDKCA